jgi:hypothetical protein
VESFQSDGWLVSNLQMKRFVYDRWRDDEAAG